MHKQKNSTVSSNLPFIIILSLCFSLIFTGCIDNKKKSENIPTPSPTPEVTKTGSGISSSSFIDPVVEKAYRKHSDENACGSMPLASVETYNKSFEMMSWISQKRGLEFDEEMFPSICAPDSATYGADQVALTKSRKLEILYTEKILKAIGLIKPNIDWFKLSIDSARNDSLGYFYSRDNRLVIDTEVSPESFDTTLVHELTHVLQYQNYPNYKLFYSFDEREKSDDEITCISAIKEGEAVITMNLYAQEFFGQEIKTDKEYIDSVIEDFGNDISLPYSRVPIFLKYRLSVPFFRELMQSGYNAQTISNIFDNPPLSSEQIFNPSKYKTGISGYDFTEFELEKYNSVFSDHKRKNTDIKSLGRIGLLSLLRTYYKEMDPLQTAAGWDGDRVLLYAKDDDFNWWDTTFIHLGKWDSFEDADNFSKLLRTMIVNKYGDKIELISPDESSFQIYVLNEEGDRDLIIIGQKADRTILVERITLEKARELSYLGDSKILDFLNERG